jgi:hypothetical protein
MAYYTFEGISNMDHFYEGFRKTTNEVFSYLKGWFDELVNTFTSAPRIEDNVVQRGGNEKHDHADSNTSATRGLYFGQRDKGSYPWWLECNPLWWLMK